jgi:hypothetical protein
MSPHEDKHCLLKIVSCLIGEVLEAAYKLNQIIQIDSNYWIKIKIICIFYDAINIINRVFFVI